MRRLLRYSDQFDSNPPLIAVYRVFGVEVRVPYNALDLDQALADAFGMTKEEFLQAEAEFDNLKQEIATVVQSLADDDDQCVTDLGLLASADLPTTKQIIGRTIQRQRHSIAQRRRLGRIVVRYVLNDDRPEVVE